MVEAARIFFWAHTRLNFCRGVVATQHFGEKGDSPAMWARIFVKGEGGISEKMDLGLQKARKRATRAQSTWTWGNLLGPTFSAGILRSFPRASVLFFLLSLKGFLLSSTTQKMEDPFDSPLAPAGACH